MAVSQQPRGTATTMSLVEVEQEIKRLELKLGEIVTILEGALETITNMTDRTNYLHDVLARLGAKGKVS